MTGDLEWHLYRGPVSHGCNRMAGEHVVELDPGNDGTSDTLISEAAIRGIYRYWREVMEL